MEAFRCPKASLLLPLFCLILLYTIFTPLKQNYSSFSFFLSPLSSIKDNIKTQPKPRLEHNTTSSIKKMTSLDRVEAGLAEARASIRQAVQWKRKKFLPKGSIYRNPYSFHQSHMEMVKRLKVWVYEEGEKPLVHDGPLSSSYAIEGHFIDEIDSSGRSPFKARHPDEANLFLIPFSITYVVKYVYVPFLSKEDFQLGHLQRLVEDYVRVVAHKYPYWNRSNGADHFLLSCHDWTPFISLANPELYKNFIRVMCNANTSEGFQPKRDVSLPGIHLHYGELGPPDLAQHPLNRSILAFFSGGEHGDIRKLLLKHWKDKDTQVQVHEYLPKGQNYTQLMGLSKFCLCPSGYEVGSPRVVEAIHAGCVPVILSRNYSLPFNDVLNWSQFSIEIPVEKIPEIKNILQNVSESKYMKLQKNVRRVRRHFLINRSAKPYDVMHMILHSIWLRRLNFRLIASQ